LPVNKTKYATDASQDVEIKFDPKISVFLECTDV
jgi:hypothetical protein